MLKLRVKQVTDESKNNDKTERPKKKENQLGILKFYTFCQKIQQRPVGLGESYWERSIGFTYQSRKYIWKVALSSPKKLLQFYLVGQGRAQLEHSSHIVKVGVEATCWHFKPDIYWRKQPNWWAHLELCHRNPDILERVPNQIALSSCGEVCTHASYKTTRTWENFNNWGTKIILFPDELWLSASKSKSFVKGISQ